MCLVLARLSSDIFTQLIFDTSARNVYITEHFLVTQKKGNLFVYLILQYSCCFVVSPQRRTSKPITHAKLIARIFWQRACAYFYLLVLVNFGSVCEYFVWFFFILFPQSGKPRLLVVPRPYIDQKKRKVNIARRNFAKYTTWKQTNNNLPSAGDP